MFVIDLKYHLDSILQILICITMMMKNSNEKLLNDYEQIKKILVQDLNLITSVGVRKK